VVQRSVVQQRWLAVTACAALLAAPFWPARGLGQARLQSKQSLPSAQAAAPPQGRSLREQLGSSTRGRGVITGATKHRLLHFTFDDGPDADQTPRLLDMLDQAGMKATFFFSTSRFVSREARNAQAIELAKEVARRGHNLGSHSSEHQRMAKLAPPALRDQLKRSDEAFEAIFGAQTRLFRPPFGSRNAALDAMLAERGDATVMWNIGMADWVERKPELVALTFFRALERNERDRGERGGVILMHDTHAWSVDAFKLIAAELERRNCAALASNEELYDSTDDLTPFVIEPTAAQLAARQLELRARFEKRCPRP
jgi:peptidoglycan/xylan/chitin deacetylase (PgdA/CDA1 family)